MEHVPEVSATPLPPHGLGRPSCFAVWSRHACGLLLLAASTTAQAAELRGTVLENKPGGPPIAEVAIGADGANARTTGSLGKYTLIFPDKQPGESVSVVVSKEGYEVVNEIQLKRALPLSPGERALDIFLCRPEVCEEMKRRFYRVKGIEAVEQSFRRRLKELEDRDQASESEVARLEREHDDALAAAERAAEDLARTRPDERSKVYQEAHRLFADGQIEEALEVLDEAKLEWAVAAAASKKAEAEQDLHDRAEEYKLRGRFLALDMKAAEAGEAFDRAVQVYPRCVAAQCERAFFLARLGGLEQARPAYESCLSLAREAGERRRLAAVLGGLGRLHEEEGRPLEARKSFEEAVDLMRDLAPQDVGMQSFLALTLNMLGSLHRNEGRLPAARSALEEALAICRDVCHVVPMLHATERRATEARRAYVEALSLYRGLAALEPLSYRPELARILYWLGALQGRGDEAHRYFEEAASVFRDLTAADSEKYRPLLARTLYGLVQLHRRGCRLTGAREVLEEASAVYRELVPAEPSTYRPLFAETLDSLALLHSTEGRLTESRASYEEASSVYRELAQTDPGAYRSDLAKILNLLGHHYILEERASEAIQSLEEALPLFRELALVNPGAYRSDLAEILNLLGHLYIQEERASEAIQSLEEAIPLFRELALVNPGAYQADLAEVLQTVAFLRRPQRSLSIPWRRR